MAYYYNLSVYLVFRDAVPCYSNYLNAVLTQNLLANLRIHHDAHHPKCVNDVTLFDSCVTFFCN